MALKRSVVLRLELTPGEAAALMRFAEKISYEQAQSVLYPHLETALRAEQASQIIAAFDMLSAALADAQVSSWPWIDTGRP
jgi:hypothetical protein